LKSSNLCGLNLDVPGLGLGYMIIYSHQFTPHNELRERLGTDTDDIITLLSTEKLKQTQQSKHAFVTKYTTT